VSGAALAVDVGERTDTEVEGGIKLGVGVWTDVAMSAEPSLAGVLRLTSPRSWSILTTLSCSPKVANDRGVRPLLSVE